MPLEIAGPALALKLPAFIWTSHTRNLQVLDTERTVFYRWAPSSLPWHALGSAYSCNDGISKPLRGSQFWLWHLCSYSKFHACLSVC